MSLSNTILSVTRRTKNGFTVGEIFDRVQTKLLNNFDNVPAYSTVRARVYELANSGKLGARSYRKDSVTGREATTYVRTSSNPFSF